jgi:hypothetical protein
LFLVLSFVFGARSARAGRSDRAVWIIAGSLVVAVLLNTQRLV